MMRAAGFVFLAAWTFLLASCSSENTSRGGSKGGTGSDEGSDTQVAMPTFSLAPGTIPYGTVVTISCATSGAEIQYSTDGVTYTAGFSYTVASSCSLYAKAKKIGLADSQTAKADYTLADIALQIAYTKGALINDTYKNIYAAWIQDQDEHFIQNLIVCKKLQLNVEGKAASGNTLTGVVLPHWWKIIFPASSLAEVDAIAGATIANQDFILPTKPVSLKSGCPRKFTVCFETDSSYEANDWFKDQPAILYSAEVDLDSGKKEYELSACQWDPNSNNSPSDSAQSDSGLIKACSAADTGILQDEMRYITAKRSGQDAFGAADSSSSATLRAKKIVLSIQ